LDKSKDNGMKQHAVIIAGEWNSQNLGDEIICNTFKYLFQDYSANQNYKLVPLPISIHKIIDEFWTYVGNKKHKLWLIAD
jgi:hypothetical protein